MRYSKPYHDAVGLQRLIVEQSKQADAKSLSMIAKSFVSLELLKMRIKMKPAPKPIDTTKMQKASRKSEQPSFSEHQ